MQAEHIRLLDLSLYALPDSILAKGFSRSRAYIAAMVAEDRHVIMQFVRKVAGNGTMLDICM